MAAAESELKSPFVPLFQRGIFLRGIPTPLWKRGEGEIFGQNETEIMWRTFGARTLELKKRARIDLLRCGDGNGSSAGKGDLKGRHAGGGLSVKLPVNLRGQIAHDLKAK